MKKVFLALLLSCCVAAGFGQTSTTSKPANQAQEGGFMGWVHDAWKTVQEQGKPAAERIVRQWPKRFKAVKQQVADLSKKAHDRIAQLDLEQKKALVLELWRVRKSLDLMTLLQPDVLQALTGLDTSGLAALERQAKDSMAFVQAQIPKR